MRWGRNRSVVAVLAVLGALSAPAPARAQTPVAHYPFDGGTADDASGNRNAGTVLGGVQATADRFGNPCGALRFNGADGYVRVPSSPSLERPRHALTVAAWCRIDPGTPANGLRWLTIVCKGDGATETPDNPQYRLQTMQTLGISQSTVSVNSEFTEFDQAFKSHLLPIGSWCFYALTYDGQAVRTYLDGAEVFSFPYTGTLVANQTPLFIGRDAPGSLEFFKGDLDDLRIYADALPASQVQQLYRARLNGGATASGELVVSCPARRVVGTAPGRCGAPVTFAPPTATSACGPVSVRQIRGPRSGEEFPVGTTTVAFLAESAAGEQQTCYALIQVEDREPPRLLCPPDTTLLTTTARPGGVVFIYPLPPATDNCAVADVRQVGGQPSGTELPVGRHTLRFEALDRQGNRREGTRVVTVKPFQPPPPPPVVVVPPPPPPPVVVVPPPVVKPPPPSVVVVPPPPPVVKLPPPSVVVVPPPPPVVKPVPLPTPPPPPVVRVPPPAPPPPLAFAPVPALVRVAKTDSVKAGPKMQFGTCAITIVAYDNADQDADTVSIFFNGDEIVHREMLHLRENGPIVQALNLRPGQKNSFIVKAWNVGRPGTPNTLKLDFYEGDVSRTDDKKLRRRDPLRSHVLHSRPGLSASLDFFCNP